LTKIKKEQSQQHPTIIKQLYLDTRFGGLTGEFEMRSLDLEETLASAIYGFSHARSVINEPSSIRDFENQQLSHKSNSKENKFLLLLMRESNAKANSIGALIDETIVANSIAASGALIDETRVANNIERRKIRCDGKSKKFCNFFIETKRSLNI